MYHSVNFGDKNTWNDWCLVPETDPIIDPPTQKTSFIDVPGADGSLDMSEVLTGYPVFNNREGELTFIAMNKNAAGQPECSPFKFRDLVSQIMDHLHGKKMQMILEDDSSYYYEGRFNIESITPAEDFNRISIKYNLSPYKWSVRSAADSWLWDPFNFLTDVISRDLLKNLAVTTAQKVVHLDEHLLGTAPVPPTFTVSATNGQGVYIRFVNPTLNIDKTLLFPNGTATNTDFILYGNNADIYYWVSSGTGLLTINYKKGRL